MQEYCSLLYRVVGGGGGGGGERMALAEQINTYLPKCYNELCMNIVLMYVIKRGWRGGQASV